MDAKDRPKQHVVVNIGPDGDHGPKAAGGHSRHRWMMLACIAPLLLIAAALILTGSVGIGSTALIVGCVAMMAVMMFAMTRDRR
jgi:Flp pilus assembly protein TadB